MATFYTDDMDDTIDIDPDEFVSTCDSNEIRELIDILVEDGHIPEFIDIAPHKKNLFDEEWDGIIGKIRGLGRLRLTNEEEETIRKIANRL
jgi:hypothetical protein